MGVGNYPLIKLLKDIIMPQITTYKHGELHIVALSKKEAREYAKELLNAINVTNGFKCDCGCGMYLYKLISCWYMSKQIKEHGRLIWK